LGGEEKDCGFVPQKWFRPAYAVTVYKYQGETITENYNIMEIKLMDRNEEYTALTRAKRLDQIQLDFTDKYFWAAKESSNPTEFKYEEGNDGYIYELHNATHNKYYVELTTTSIEQRIKEHLDFEDDPLKNTLGGWTHS
jgi:hypothetical protein